MRIHRRTLLGRLPLAATLLTAALAAGKPTYAQADEAYIPRVGGEVSAQNFGSLADLAIQSVNSVIGLKISVPEGEHDGLVAEETGGLLVLYMRKGDVELAFPSGYRKDRGRFFFDGFYNATYAGMRQGINAVHLAPARTMDVEAIGKPVRAFAIGDLPAAKGG